MEFVSVVSSVATILLIGGLVTNWCGSFYRGLTQAHAVRAIILREVKTLQEIVGECADTLEGLSEVPSHVKDTILTCYDSGNDIEPLINKRMMDQQGLESSSRRRRLTAAVQLYSFSGDSDLVGKVSQFRQDVYLLRDMCSGLKTQKDLLEATAAILRLMTLTEHANTSNQEEFEGIRRRMSEMGRNIWEDDHESGCSTPREKTQCPTEYGALNPIGDTTTTAVSRYRGNIFMQQVQALSSANYVIDAVVLVENPNNHGGLRFNPQPAGVEYYPGRVKLDTGSEGDFVSIRYLRQAGFDIETLHPIPVEDQSPVEGIGGVCFTPQSKVELRWYRSGEANTRRDQFLVVDAPFDLLLSSRRFVSEAKRMRAFPLMGPRKTKEVRALEMEDMRKRLEQAKKQEARERDEMRLRRHGLGRVTSVQTVQGQGDNIV